jgi:hypothetical protein
MPIFPNVVGPVSPSDAALSQILNQDLDDLLATELAAFQQIHDRPHVRQQRRVPQLGLIQDDLFQSHGDGHRQFLRHGFRERGRRRIEGCRCRLAWGTGRARTAGIKMLLLPLTRGRTIVGGTALPRRLPLVVLSAAERTPQILAAGVPRMGEKANSAMTAEYGAALQIGMRLEGGVQRRQILPDQGLGAIILMPIRPK